MSETQAALASTARWVPVRGERALPTGSLGSAHAFLQRAVKERGA